MPRKPKMVRARKKDVGKMVVVNWEDGNNDALLVEAEPSNKRYVKVFCFKTNELQTVRRVQIVEVGKSPFEAFGAMAPLLM